MKRVAVVILNWNGRQLLEQFLPFVVDYTTSDEVEIVVADNASTDDSIAFVKKIYPQIKLIVLPQNCGYAEGYNQALKQVEAEYFVLLNSDVEVTPNWLHSIISYLDTHKDVAAAQPKILAQRNKKLFEYAGAAGGFIDKYGYPFCRGRIFGEVEEDKGQYDSIVDVFWASGACLFIRSKDFFDVGGFDSSFFAHMEEIDMCWRLNARGRRIVCVPSSVVYHVGGATLAEESPRKTFLNFRNNLLMIYKNIAETDLKPVLRKRAILDYMAATKFVLTGKLSNAEAIMKARNEFSQIKNEYSQLRANNLRQTKVAHPSTMYPYSILNDFYKKGKRIFSELSDFMMFGK